MKYTSLNVHRPHVNNLSSSSLCDAMTYISLNDHRPHVNNLTCLTSVELSFFGVEVMILMRLSLTCMESLAVCFIIVVAVHHIVAVAEVQITISSSDTWMMNYFYLTWMVTLPKTIFKRFPDGVMYSDWSAMQSTSISSVFDADCSVVIRPLFELLIIGLYVFAFCFERFISLCIGHSMWIQPVRRTH